LLRAKSIPQAARVLHDLVDRDLGRE